MEKLRTYLEGKRKGEFARRLKISPAYLSMLISPVSKRRPSFDLMLRIERETDGFVGLKSWADAEVEQ